MTQISVIAQAVLKKLTTSQPALTGDADDVQALNELAAQTGTTPLDQTNIGVPVTNTATPAV